MNRERAAFLVMVDLDPIPGWGHEPESWQRHLEAYLLSSAGHYNPVVVELTPTDLEPMKRAEREAGAAEVRARVEAVIERPPVWGPNENGDLMLDMSLDGFQADIRAALNGGE